MSNHEEDKENASDYETPVKEQRRTLGEGGKQHSHISDLSDWSNRQADKEERRLSIQSKQFLQQTSTYWRSTAESQRRMTTYMVEKIRRNIAWLNSFKRLDPRFQILMYFDEVARQGGPLNDPLAPPLHSFDLMRGFTKSTAFTVWRPTSNEAICRMMKGEATGKGLDVKGKSAKCGKLSGLVPFLQIYVNDQKVRLRRPPSNGRISIYYKSQTLRDVARKKLTAIAAEMKIAVLRSKRILSRVDIDEDEKESALEKLTWVVEDWKVYELNQFGFGLDVPERVFFEVFIIRQDLRRDLDEEIGRPSEPAFQDMNFHSTRTYSGTGPRVVVLQTSESGLVFRPQTLVVAYEEQGRVTPVASDFDCFTVGTRGVVYDSPMPGDQIDLMKWLINNIEKVLDGPRCDRNWTSRWLDILKENTLKGFHPEVPKCGFGDPKSYTMMEGGVSRFSYNGNGAVRHGAESFNYFFPQELDKHFLVISDTLPGRLPWKYVDSEELKNMLLEKVDEEFCFPINPKWILADKGWKKIYDKMMASPCEGTQISLETWYPKSSGIREMIESVYQRFPDGFVRERKEDSFRYSVMIRERSEAMNLAKGQLYLLAEDELRRYRVLQRAKVKLRAALLFKSRGECAEVFSKALHSKKENRNCCSCIDFIRTVRTSRSQYGITNVFKGF